MNHDSTSLPAGLNKTAGIRYILERFPELARKLDLTSKSDFSSLTSRVMSSLGHVDLKVVTWIKILLISETIDLSDHLNSTLKIESGFDREHQRACLNGFAIWSGWGANVERIDSLKH